MEWARGYLLGSQTVDEDCSFLLSAFCFLLFAFCFLKPLLACACRQVLNRRPDGLEIEIPPSGFTLATLALIVFTIVSGVGDALAVACGVFQIGASLIPASMAVVDSTQSFFLVRLFSSSSNFNFSSFLRFAYSSSTQN